MPKKSYRPRRRPNRKRFVKRKRSDARVKKLALQAVNAQKVMKRFPNDGLNFQNPNPAGNSWLCFIPTDIGASGTTSAQQDISRLTNETWIQRMSGIMDIQIGETTIKPVEFRKMCGWYKGSAKPNDPQNSAFNSAHLQSSFPTRLTRYDPDNFKIIEDKSWSVTPKLVYDNNGSDDRHLPDPTGMTDGMPQAEQFYGVWNPQTVKCSFQLNRVFRYTDANDSAAGTNIRDGLVLNGAYLVGWVPFIAIQMRCPQQAFTEPSGNNPAPVIDYKFTTYFKDNF